MIKWFFFETVIGDLVLALFERLTGLALIEIDAADKRELAPA